MLLRKEGWTVWGGDLKPRGFHPPGGSLEKVEGAGALGKEVSGGKTDKRKERGACSLLLGFSNPPSPWAKSAGAGQPGAPATIKGLCHPELRRRLNFQKRRIRG